MTKALSILRGRFGRVALLDMDTSLVDHAHPHFHLIFKASGPDQNFMVEGKPVPLRSDMLVAVNSWQQHAYMHLQGAERTLFLALYIEPGWLVNADRAFANCAEPGFFPHPGIAITNEINHLRAELVRRMAGPLDRHDELQELILQLCLTVSYGFSDWRERGAANAGPLAPGITGSGGRCGTCARGRQRPSISMTLPGAPVSLARISIICSEAAPA